MNILININKVYIKPAAVMLYSLIINNPGIHTIFVMHSELSFNDLEELKNYLKNTKFKLINIDMKNYIPSGFLNSYNVDRWPITVYYRLFAPFIIKNVDRILYLDSDMIIHGDLSKLYNLDFKSNLIACAEDTFVNDFENLDYLNLSENFRYANSGMVLFNVEGIKKKFNLNNLFSIIKEQQIYFKYPDQDTLNLMYTDSILYVDFRKYNFICSYGRYTKRQEKYYKNKAIIFHYGGESYNKPWNLNYIGNFSHIFWMYANKCVYMNNKQILFISHLFKPLNRFFVFISVNCKKIKGKLFK